MSTTTTSRQQTAVKILEAAAATATAVRSSSSSDLTFWENAQVGTFCVTVIGSFFWVPAALIYTYRRCCKTRKRKIIFWLSLLAVLFMPVRPYRRIKKFPMWDLIYRYFGTRIVRPIRLTTTTPTGSAAATTTPGPPPKQSIYACVPHGIFPMGVALTAMHDKTNMEVCNDARVVVADAIYHTPIIGQLLKLLGAVKAGGKAVETALKAGHSLIIAPGGIGEIYLTGTPTKEFALLKNRKGFIKRAVEAGCSITPIYVFGAADTFRQMTPDWLARISRLLKVSLVFFWGRLGLPIPFNVPLLLAVGEPICPPAGADVDDVHGQFCRTMVDLFDRYKSDYPGWENKTLEIV